MGSILTPPHPMGNGHKPPGAIVKLSGPIGKGIRQDSSRHERRATNDGRMRAYRLSAHSPIHLCERGLDLPMTVMMIERKTISIMKACELVGVSRRTIYNWIASGKVEYVRTAGGSVRIFVDTLWREPSRASALTSKEAS